MEKMFVAKQSTMSALPNLLDRYDKVPKKGSRQQEYCGNDVVKENVLLMFSLWLAFMGG